MPNLELTEGEVAYLMFLVLAETEYWQDNLETEAERKIAILAATLSGKLKGKDAQTAELEARRDVDAWMAENNAPGGA